ncbi:MAG: GNAT family N-acetyltransferase [Tumebacillaceae bacterium]
MEIILKKVTTVPELEVVAELERKVWGAEPIPVHQTATSMKNGGIVIGAYDGEKLVGFSYGFAGFANGETYLCSHMMGIDPDYQSQGIGYRLKIAQAEEARQIGYRKIRWTYDPLESRNAFLNIAKLGAICSDYIENCYGDMNDELNRGLPTDRFNVEWLIQSSHLEQRFAQFADVRVDRGRSLLGWEAREDGFPQATERVVDWETDAEFYFVPMPVAFQKMKKTERELAINWRMRTRQVLSDAFASGWAVAHIVPAVNEEPVQHYVLVRREKLALE